MNSINQLIDEAQSMPEYWEEKIRLEYAILLNEKMQEHGISREELCERGKITKRYLSQILGAEAKGLKVDTMSKLIFSMGEELTLGSKKIQNNSFSTQDITCNSIDYEQPDFNQGECLGSELVILQSEEVLVA